MKALKIIGALFLALVVFIVVTMVRYGYFEKLTVVDETVPALTAITARHTGPYQNVGPIMGELYNDALAAQFEGKVGIGIYYDNPDTVAADSLRALVGQVLAEGDSAKVDSLKGEYQLVTIPEFQAKVVHFPYKGQLSIIFAILKVYPFLQKECGEDIKTATIEMYDIQGKEIRFIVPQSLTKEQMEAWLELTSKNSPTSVELEKSATVETDTTLSVTAPSSDSIETK